VELGWKVFRPRNNSENKKNGSIQGNKDLKKFKENKLQEIIIIIINK
jgi:hypothetical protein